MAADRFERSWRRRALRSQAIAYKGGKCQICGYLRCTAALDFHHLDPLAKDFSISSRMTSFEAIQKELNKCVLVCSNCHREIHDGWHPGFIVYEDSDRGYDAYETEEPFSSMPISDPDRDPNN